MKSLLNSKLEKVPFIRKLEKMFIVPTYKLKKEGNQITKKIKDLGLLDKLSHRQSFMIIA
jgi:hypothetical protein